MKLNRNNLSNSGKESDKALAALMNLPEKVLQFGTGVLLRGLPDYYIDKANKQGVFNGRVLIVKTTDSDSSAFDAQDGLFTHSIRGISNGSKIEEDIINASISRVLAAKEAWPVILATAANPDMEIVISNTTEVGISLLPNDDIHAVPPVSFPAKLLAFLYKRFEVFEGDVDKGMVILPTELITENGDKLKAIVNELAVQNKLPASFIAWLQNANYFCNTLVDRIVPGKLNEAGRKAAEAITGYEDELTITSESYSLWAIESGARRVTDTLSFAKTDSGVVIAPDINKFRELKLRLLNGTHTFTSGLAYIAGITTVKEAMDNEFISGYISNLMLQEIAPQILNKNLLEEEAVTFAGQVMDRFRNPHIEHKWLSICVQYSSKMKMRNLPILLKHYSNSRELPSMMALGFAAHLLFMKCEAGNDGKYYGHINGADYVVQDDNAAYFAAAWKAGYRENLVKEILSDAECWGQDLHLLPNFAEAVDAFLQELINGNIFKLSTVNQAEKLKV